MPEVGFSQAQRRAPFPGCPSLLATHPVFISLNVDFQVLSPGDVAFTLGAGNDSYIVSNSAEWDPNNICMSLTSLVGGLVMLLGLFLLLYIHTLQKGGNF